MAKDPRVTPDQSDGDEGRESKAQKEEEDTSECRKRARSMAEEGNRSRSQSSGEGPITKKSKQDQHEETKKKRKIMSRVEQKEMLMTMEIRGQSREESMRVTSSRKVNGKWLKMQS